MSQHIQETGKSWSVPNLLCPIYCAADAVSVAVLKKALNIQAQGALQLVQAATQSMQTVNNPPHLGNNIDLLA